MHSIFTFTHIAKKLLVTYFLGKKRKIKFPLYLSFVCFFMLGSLHLKAQNTGDYRSATSGARGNWEDTTSWQRYNGSIWIAVSTTPSATDEIITILGTDSIFINANVSIDQAIVQNGGYLEVRTGTVTINDGAGTDLTLNSPNAMVWGTGPQLIVNSGALIDGSSANIFYRGAVLLNNGTININTFDMSPDPGAQTINGPCPA